MQKAEPARFAKQVVVVQDAFTSYFETQLVIDVFTVLRHVGFEPSLMPYHPNGKPLHVHGFLPWFRRVAKKHVDLLNAVDRLGVPMVGVDPSMTLTYRSEYLEAGLDVPRVRLIQELLAERLSTLEIKTVLPVRQYRLFAHCTEATNANASLASWQAVFATAGQSLSVESVGCCGMAGTFGHETRHVDTSKTIYTQSWQPKIEENQCAAEILATGYSCRVQVKRFSNQTVKHPMTALREVLVDSEQPA
jgi:Fe-S oxidoreductase